MRYNTAAHRLWIGWAVPDQTIQFFCDGLPCSWWSRDLNGFNGCGAIKSKWGIGHGICGGIRVPFIFIHRRRCHRCVPWGLWYGSALLAFDLLHLRQLQLFLWSDPSGPGVLEWIFYFLRGNNFLVCLKKNTRLMICGQRWIGFSKTDGCNGPGMNGSHSIFSLGALFSLGLGQKIHVFP